MAGERKRAHSRGGKEINTHSNPDSNQEYHFFVTQDGGGETRETDAADQLVKAKKKYGRSKGKTFFGSE
jgi:hypothetical protein